MTDDVTESVAQSDPIAVESEVVEIPRITDKTDVLLRQVIEQWTNADETPKSVAFRPTPKDEQQLSTDHDVQPAEAFAGYKKRTGNAPAGTWGLGVGAILDCHDDLFILKDGGTSDLHDSHASIVFPAPAVSNNALRRVHERIAKELKAEALKRKRLHPPA
jgi:hypothetical protein